MDIQTFLYILLSTYLPNNTCLRNCQYLSKLSYQYITLHILAYTYLSVHTFVYIFLSILSIHVFILSGLCIYFPCLFFCFFYIFIFLSMLSCLYFFFCPYYLPILFSITLLCYYQDLIQINLGTRKLAPKKLKTANFFDKSNEFQG